MKTKIVICLLFVFLLVATASAKDFVIYNSSNPAQNYFVINGTTTNVNSIGNISASWLLGIFNWIVGSTSQNYLAFNGTQLDFNETYLNGTIDKRVSSNLSGLVNGSGTYGYIPMWNGTTSINNSNIYQNGSNIGIGVTNPAELLQIGSSVVFHNGGNKIIAFGYSPSSGQSIVNSTPSEIRWDPNSGILSLGTDSINRTVGQSTGIVNTLSAINGRVGINTLTPNYSLDVNGNAQVNNLYFRNGGIGVPANLTFLKTNDQAWIGVTEVVSDQTTYGFYMRDNPDDSTDKFLWQIGDFQGSGGDWQPLQFAGLDANIRASDINAYGTYSVYGPWYSGPSGTPNTIRTSVIGTLGITLNISGYTGDTNVYWIVINGTGSPNTFDWGRGQDEVTGSFGTIVATNVPITGSAQTLENGVTITFNGTSGGVHNDLWQFRVNKGGRLLVSNGSVSSPSLSFTQDNNTGIYLPATDTVGISTAGSNRATINSTGLSATGDISATGNIYSAGQNITSWNSTGLIRNWNASGYLINWSQQGAQEPNWNANYSNFSNIYGYALNGSGWVNNYSNFLLSYNYSTNGTFLTSSNISGMVNGSGTYGYIPMWNGTTSINNSAIYQNGSNVGIGTTNPKWNLTIGSPYTTVYAGHSIVADNRIGSYGSNGIGVSLATMGPYGEVYAYDYNNSIAKNLVLNEFGGNVGVNTTTPQNTFNVNGDINATGTVFAQNTKNLSIGYDYALNISSAGFVNGSGTYGYIPMWNGTTSINNSILYQNGTSIGFMTTSPGGLSGPGLDINGSIRINDAVTPGNAEIHLGTSYDNRILQSGGNLLGLMSTGGVVIGIDADNATGNSFKVIKNTSWPFGTEPPLFTVLDTGNVGVNTTTPNSTLQVSGNVTIGLPTNYQAGLQISNDGGVGRQLSWGSNSGFTTYGHIDNSLITGAFGQYLAFGSNDTERLRILASGEIGINTTTPQNALNVNGDINATGTVYAQNTKNLSLGYDYALNISSIGFVNGSGTYGYIPMWNGTTSINNSAIYQNGSNVGIGTTSPQGLFEINYSSTGFPFDIRRANNASTGAIGLLTGSTADWLIGERSTYSDSDFHVFNYETNSDAITILRQNSNVGIGTAAPNQSLDIIGKIQASGNFKFNDTNLSIVIGSDTGSTLAGLTALGYQAAKGSTGQNSVALGYLAGNQNSGLYLTATGYQAGNQNNGNYTTSIGSYSGYQNNGSRVVFVGYNAGFQNNGSSITSLGTYSGYQNNGSDAVFVGYNAGYQNAGLSSISALGNYAGYQNNASYLTAIGYNAGYQNTGASVTTLGYVSGYQNTGISLTAIGSNSGQLNNGSFTTFVGSNSGFNNTGNYSSGFGTSALSNNTGNNAVAIGYQSGFNNNVSYLTALGYQAGYLNTGFQTTALGYLAGSGNNGTDLVALGGGAGFRNNGSEVTALGTNSGASNNGSYLTAIGSGSAYINVGNYITVLGYNAGWGNTGNSTVAIGYQAGMNNTLSNQFIVQQGNVNATPLIQGNFGSGFVGIGTAAPNQSLDIIGNLYASGNFRFNMSNESTIIGINNATLLNNVTVFGSSAANGSTGTQITAIGQQSAYYNTGNYLTAIGQGSGYQNSGATWVTALGFQSALQNSGDLMTGVGAYSGFKNTGNESTFFGANSGEYNNGQQVTTVGRFAGEFGNGSGLTVIGYQAGLNSTGNYSSGLGYSALYNNTGNNVIALGYQAGMNNNFSNQFIVQQGNVNAIPLIQGNFSSGFVGIGTSTPKNTLNVLGGINVTGVYTNANFSSNNITLTNGTSAGRICLNQGCTSYIYNNGTGVVIQG